MTTPQKKYVFDENNRPIAVQLPIEDYNKIEQIIEDYGLAKLIEETENEESLTVIPNPLTPNPYP